MKDPQTLIMRKIATGMCISHKQKLFRLQRKEPQGSIQKAPQFTQRHFTSIFQYLVFEQESGQSAAYGRSYDEKPDLRERRSADEYRWPYRPGGIYGNASDIDEDDVDHGEREADRQSRDQRRAGL
jgi:hypothetical protein